MNQETKPTMYTRDWFVEKFITPVATGVVLAAFSLIAPDWIASRLQPPTCSDPRGLVQEPVAADRVSEGAKQSDNFETKGPVSYAAANLVDGNTSTAWVEPEPGLGLGSGVTLSFEDPVDLRLICVVNGYAESWDLYKRNSRARLLEIKTDSGLRSAMLADAGSPDRPALYQEADCPLGLTSEIELTLRSAYAAQRDTASTQAYEDTSISEVEVWVEP